MGLLSTMVKMSVLNDALKKMVNAEKAGKRQVLMRPVSKVVVKFLRVMQKHGYINAFECIDDVRSGKIIVDLNGRLNKCGVISPRFDLKLKNFENFVYQILPPDSSVSSFSLPTRVSWTILKLERTISVVRSSDSSTDLIPYQNQSLILTLFFSISSDVFKRKNTLI